MTDERLFGIAPDGSDVPPAGRCRTAACSSLSGPPTRRRPTRGPGTPLPGRAYTEAVREAGLDFDHDVPADLAVGNDRQLWRLDDDVWHSEPLRPTE